MVDLQKVDEARRALLGATNILVVTGAGVPRASGIATFRDAPDSV